MRGRAERSGRHRRARERPRPSRSRRCATAAARARGDVPRNRWRSSAGPRSPCWPADPAPAHDRRPGVPDGRAAGHPPRPGHRSRVAEARRRAEPPRHARATRAAATATARARRRTPRTALMRADRRSRPSLAGASRSPRWSSVRWPSPRRSSWWRRHPVRPGDRHPGGADRARAARPTPDGRAVGRGPGRGLSRGVALGRDPGQRSGRPETEAAAAICEQLAAGSPTSSSPARCRRCWPRSTGGRRRSSSSWPSGTTAPDLRAGRAPPAAGRRRRSDRASTTLRTHAVRG